MSHKNKYQHTIKIAQRFIESQQYYEARRLTQKLLRHAEHSKTTSPHLPALKAVNAYAASPFDIIIPARYQYDSTLLVCLHNICKTEIDNFDVEHTTPPKTVTEYLHCLRFCKPVLVRRVIEQLQQQPPTLTQIQHKLQLAEDNCAICIDSMYCIEITEHPFCQHKFHLSCLQTTLTYHSYCPLCRQLSPIQGNIIDLSDALLIDNPQLLKALQQIQNLSDQQFYNPELLHYCFQIITININFDCYKYESPTSLIIMLKLLKKIIIFFAENYNLASYKETIQSLYQPLIHRLTQPHSLIVHSKIYIVLYQMVIIKILPKNTTLITSLYHAIKKTLINNQPTLENCTQLVRSTCVFYTLLETTTILPPGEIISDLLSAFSKLATLPAPQISEYNCYAIIQIFNYFILTKHQCRELKQQLQQVQPDYRGRNYIHVLRLLG